MEMVRSEGLMHEYAVRGDDGEITQRIRELDQVDLTVQAGEFIAILGHNGSGKSTFAKHVNALLFPDGGTLWVDGIDTKEEERLWEIRQKAGMVFQNPDNQIIASVVEEDVAFGPENLGVGTNKDPHESGRFSARRQYAGGTAAIPPNKLSGGQKQRVAIAGVLAMKPKCIVLDEPTAMLDPSGRQEVMGTIRRLNREDNITILHITHYMEEAVQADRVVVMDHGKVVLNGTPREVFSQVEAIKEIGLDVPQMTELAYRLRQEGLEVPADILTVEEMVDALCRLK